MELDPAHSRHLDIGDQACGFSAGEEISGNRPPRKRFDRVAQQRHELSHGLAKGLIILDDRDQCTFRHCGFQQSLPAHIGAAQVPRACMQLRNVGEGSRQCNAGGPKRWLMRSTIRLGSRGCWWSDGL